MIIRNLSSIDQYNIQVVIIGSGPAGITTALKLEEYKIKSLIIEVGDIEQKEDANLFLDGEVVGGDYPDLSSLRMRQFGGTSGHWGGSCNYFTEDDLETWPIDLEDISIYFDKTKDILGINKNFYNQNFSNNLRNYNLLDSGVRFGDKYYNKVKNSKYIYLTLNTCFLNFNSKNSNKKVTSINCVKDKKEYKIKSRFFILACGGIENSRLLLWSREKNKNLLDHGLPIGESYMNHPAYKVGEGIVNLDKYNSYFQNNQIKTKPYITCNKITCFSSNKKFLQDNNIHNSAIYMEFIDSWDVNSTIEQLRCVAPKYFKEIYEDILNDKIFKIKIRTVQEQSPKLNRIVLGNKTDPIGIPKSKIFWKQTNKELESARKITEEIGKLFIDYGLGRISLYEHMYSGEKDYPLTVGNHQLGGTNMGESIQDSVVNKNLKVHGVENLFISGSSVFTTSGHCHPTFTIIALSLRLGDYIKSQIN